MARTTAKQRAVVALAIALGFYALSDILLWQRIFEANKLWTFDTDYLPDRPRRCPLPLARRKTDTGCPAVARSLASDLHTLGRRRRDEIGAARVDGILDRRVDGYARAAPPHPTDALARSFRRLIENYRAHDR